MIIIETEDFKKDLKNLLFGLLADIEFFFILGMEKLYSLRLAIEKKFTGKFKQISLLGQT
jgi:hypothetical protein